MHRAALPAGYCEPSPAELIEEQVRLAEAEAEEAEAEALYNEDDLLDELDELERLGEELNRGRQAEEDDLRELEQRIVLEDSASLAAINAMGHKIARAYG